MMKILKPVSFLLMTLAVLICTTDLSAASETTINQDLEATDETKKISTEELKKLIDDKRPALIIDARKNNRGGLIPGAKHLSYNVSDGEMKAFLKAVPLETIIVVYCSNIYCPVSGYLAKRLTLLGYTNVYKYPDGLAGWLDKDYPTDPEPSSNGK